MFLLRETIRSSADLRNHYSEISRVCRENDEAVIVGTDTRALSLMRLHHSRHTRLD